MPGLFFAAQRRFHDARRPEGGHSLVLRYSEPVRRSALLKTVSERLPPPDPSRLQFLTREFRPAEWGETSPLGRCGRTPDTSLLRNGICRCPTTMLGKRPWYKVAMAAFRDQTLPEAQAAASSLVAWTRCTRFSPRRPPSISAAVAARDPSGEILIVTYDLPLDEVAKFTTTVRPSPRGLMFVLTDDGRLLGPASR